MWVQALVILLVYVTKGNNCKTIPLSKTFAYTGVSLLTGLSCNFFEVNNLRSDMTCTLVSSSPHLNILPHGIHGDT